MTISDLGNLFERKCTNLYRSANDNGKPMRYNRADLTEWAKQACARGDIFFYANLVDPNNPQGAMYLTDANYEYNMSRGLTEEEYKEVFGNEQLQQINKRIK